MDNLLKISFSAGHGLFTNGKRTPDGMKEWEFNSVVVKYIIQSLSEYQNVACLRLDDPTGKTDIPLTERSNRSNSWGADTHIDLHANAFGNDWNDANGIETFVNSLADTKSVELAKHVQSEMIHYTGLTDRGVKSANGSLHMLREVKAKTKILVEAGFMTNRKEAELLKSDKYRRLIANCIIESLVEVYGLKKREARKEAPKVELSVLSPVEKLEDNQRRMMDRLVGIGLIAKDYKPSALDLKYFSMFDIMARKAGLYDK